MRAGTASPSTLHCTYLAVVEVLLAAAAGEGGAGGGLEHVVGLAWFLGCCDWGVVGVQGALQAGGQCSEGVRGYCSLMQQLGSQRAC